MRSDGIEFYGKGLDAQSRNHIWSATKSYTSTLVAMALFEGKISGLDDTAEHYAPQFKGTAYGETSVRHLLMMSSGIDYFHFKGRPNRNDMYNDLIQQGGDFDKWAAALPRRVPGGTDFNYIATDTHVLAAVLQGAYGKPFVEIVQEKLWEPFGFNDAQWGLDSHGHATGHFALSLTLQDFAHLGQIYLEDLKLNGEPGISAEERAAVMRALGTFVCIGFQVDSRHRELRTLPGGNPPRPFAKRDKNTHTETSKARNHHPGGPPPQFNNTW